jgi:isoquinoline 1-oxidoreductase alpha subunit
MSAAALLARTSNPSDEQIAGAMNGSLCRCGTYIRIGQAVRRAAQLNAATDARGAK